MFKKNMKDAGLLFLRVGIGGMFLIFHGGPKLLGGTQEWIDVGQAMEVAFGIKTGFAFWGFLAAASEAIGGLFLIMGLFSRPALVFLIFTMLVATTMHIRINDPLVPNISYPVEMAILFASLVITGPGRFSLDHTLFRDDR